MILIVITILNWITFLIKQDHREDSIVLFCTFMHISFGACFVFVKIRIYAYKYNMFFQINISGSLQIPCENTKSIYWL